MSIDPSVERLVSGFDRDTFREFINQKSSGTFAPLTRAIPVDETTPWGRAEQLGVVKVLPGPNETNRPLIVVAAELPAGEVLRERSSRLKQFRFARAVLEDAVANPSPDLDGLPAQGLFVFHDRDGNFRLSLVYAAPKGTKLEWSTFRRYSFYVEVGAGNKTFRDRAALPWTTFDHLADAFSVEKLTKEFYRRLFDWYQRLMDSPEVVFPNDVVTDREPGAVKSEQIIRLITRLMFVWFLKQKHLVPDQLFDPDALREILNDFKPAEGFTYYRAILQNLFFATLNSEIPDRAFAADGGTVQTNAEHFDIKTLYRYGGDFAWSREKVLQLFHGIPFLNGGLFECLDRGRDYHDGFSRNTEKQARVPNRLFFDETNGLLPLLGQYNFTVEENSPGDEEVALDPELLGKVFENLLAAYNPETNVQARKATGSFYTPREIVNYMVDESLIAHLTTKCGEEHEAEFRTLFSEGAAPEDPKLTDRIDEALTTARILDPACGSGAFPMGALLRMVDILRTVRRIPEDQSVYDLKLELIENAIYGADIQTIAVQISKLRFFISLIAEQQPTADAEHNYGIHSLPNLETKFVAANSLIGLPHRTDALPMQDVEDRKQHLWEVRHRHFQARSYREKKELRKQDLALRTALAESLEDGGGFDTEAAHLMAAWDPYDQNTSAPFLDPEWMFNVRDGFDVVIGNPPYVRTQTLKQENPSLLATLRWTYSTACKGNFDLYIVFVELGLRLLNSHGELSFIIPNKFFNSNYGYHLRSLLSQSRHLRRIVDFGDQQVFPGASNYVCLLFLTKKGISKCSYVQAFNLPLWLDSQRPTENNSIAIPAEHIDEKEWNFALRRGLSLISRVEKAPILVEDVAAFISQGVRTSANDVFVVDIKDVDDNVMQAFSKRLNEVVPIDTGSTLRFLRGRDIKRYHFSDSRKALVMPYKLNGKTMELIRDHVFSSQYPNTWQYLEDNRNYLEQREKSRLKGTDRWYGYIYPKNLDVMRNTKLIVPDIAHHASFSWDQSGEFAFASGYAVVLKKDAPLSYPFLLGLLNSRLLDYYWKHISTPLRGGFFRYFANHIEKLPVFPETVQEAPTIVDLVTRIIATEKSDPSAGVSALEAEIDQLVYQLYDLTPEEIAIVEESTAAGSQVKKTAPQPSAAKKSPRKKSTPDLPPSLPGWD
jgi:type I restriction-modification system DNA methylase subunit